MPIINNTGLISPQWLYVRVLVVACATSDYSYVASVWLKPRPLIMSMRNVSELLGFSGSRFDGSSITSLHHKVAW